MTKAIVLFNLKIKFIIMLFYLLIVRTIGFDSISFRQLLYLFHYKFDVFDKINVQ